MSKKVVIRGEHDQQTIDQLLSCMDHESAVHGVLCADGHLGYSQPVGGVIAYRDMVSVSGVGYDIGCGNTAIRLNLRASDLTKDNYYRYGKLISEEISFGVGRNNDKMFDHPLFEKDSHPAWDIPFINEMKRMALGQLGTIGSGNHYVDVFEGSDGYVWIGVHFGSRGLGHKIASHYLKLGGGKEGVNEPATLLDVNSDLGREYLMAMELAGLYASAGRQWVVDYVARQIFDVDYTRLVENHHNFAWKENHLGEDLYVVRKGATPLFKGQLGFVGGSMGDISVILEGTGGGEELLHSTVHGSGRILSRTKAAGKFKGWGKNRVKVSDGLVNEQEMRQNIISRDTELFGAGPDEAPQCYRQLHDVLDHHRDTARIDVFLVPKIVVMAGCDVEDPYKD